MKYKLLRLSLLSMLCMLFGGGIYAALHEATNDDVVYSLIVPKTSGNSDYTKVYDVTVDELTWSVPGNQAANDGLRLGGKAIEGVDRVITGKSAIPAAVGKIVINHLGNTSDKLVLNSITLTVASDAAFANVVETKQLIKETDFTYKKTTEGTIEITPTGDQWDANSYYKFAFNLTNPNNSNYAFTIVSIVFYAPGTSDPRTATTVTLADGYATSGAVGTQIDLPTATVKAGDNPINATVTWSSGNENVAEIVGTKINLKAAGTAVITASYAGDNSNKPSSASYTVTAYGATYTTLSALQEAATATSTPVQITFNNVYVTAVKNKNAYLADADGYGALIYTDGHGLTAGKVLNGTTQANLVLYKGYAELTDFSTTGLEITDGEYTPLAKTIDALTTANQCAVVTLKNVTYSATDVAFSDGTNSIKYYDTFGAAVTLTDGAAYDVTGVVVLFQSNNETVLEICPRTADDVVEAATVDPAGFRDIVADLTSAALLPEGAAQWDDVSTGIAVAEDGTLSRIAKEGAAIVFNGKWHGTQYGWANFSATVPVEGCVKITLGGSNYGSGAVTVTDSEGATVATIDNHIGAMWSANSPDNVAVGYYRTNAATVLSFSTCDYLPYFAVEAIDEADLPVEVTNYNITFAAGEGVSGTVPAALEVAAGGKFTAPVNYTLYKEGYTLNGWESGDAVYLPGQEITPEADMTLTAHFVQNEVSLADRTAPVTLTYNLSGYNDAPKYNFQKNTGIIVTQATVGGKAIDVRIDVDATNGKFAHNGSGWHQVNTGTKVTVPSCKGATVSVKTYQNANALKFGETAATAEADPATYTATDDADVVVIEQTANGYWNKLEITLPVVQEEVAKIYLIGDMNGWSRTAMTEMTYNTEKGVYEYQWNAGGNGEGKSYFAVATKQLTEEENAADADWSTFNANYRWAYAEGDQNVTLDTEVQLVKGNGSIVLSEPGTYNLTLTKDMKLTVSKTGAAEDIYVVAGWLKETEDAGFFGEKWNGTLEANKLEKQENGTYAKTWAAAELPVGTIEYKIVKNGNTWIPEGDNLFATVETAGKYDVTVVFNAETQEASMTLAAVEEPQPSEPVTLTWSYDADNPIPTTSPDNGLYFASYVNDAAGTNNGMHGVKLNSSGWAYFEKPAVAGTLTLTIGNRKTADPYEVNVSRGTLGGDGKATKGELIGTVAVTESPGTGSIELPADVTGIYIDRKSGSEGVLQKIVFKEFVPRSFVDFEMNLVRLASEFDVTTLPTGVSFTGTYNSDDHGYRNVTIVVPVDGTVKFTIGGCQYYTAGAFPVKNAANETIATLDPKTATCYHQDGSAITYIYTGEADVLTFGPIQYLPYFKAEATEVSEAVITYKDQNGNVLGKKTVYEGDPIGEVPAEYESQLTIPEGEKFRGWVYANKVKIKATDAVNGDVSVNASVTPIEQAPEVGSIQTYDLTSNIFYPEDHENFSVEGGAYYNNHGFTFDAGGSFKVNVTGKAQIVLTLCQYGNGTTITAYDTMGAVISNEIPAKADADGGTTVVNYEGPDGELTFEFAAQTYLHKVTVYNVSEFLEKDTESDYYIVPAGDAASLIMAINAASSEPNSKIFLPNGTYDLGESVLTTVSGNNVSIIGESMEGVIIKNAPPTSQEGLGKADLLVNTGTGLYLQDLTLQNALDYYSAGSAGRAPTLHDQGTKTINKNVRHLSYQDTYYSHKVGGVYYFEGGEIHGCVDYMCGNGKVYFNEMKIVNEKRSSATISANSELYVYNNCVVENNADQYNLGRAWSDHPVCIYLNTTLLDNGEKLVATRWNPGGINCDYSKAGEYGTKDASGTDITPATNVVTFTKENTTLETILTANEAATYTIDNTLGAWATEAQQLAAQVEAPAAELKDGVISWTPANNGAIAYMICKNGEFLGITTESSYVVETITDNSPRRADEADVYTIRAANARGGFGEPATVSIATGINAVRNGQLNGKEAYTLQGVRVNGTAQKGVYIVNGKKVVVK